VSPSEDAQASYLHTHIVQETGDGEAEEASHTDTQAADDARARQEEVERRERERATAEAAAEEERARRARQEAEAAERQQREEEDRERRRREEEEERRKREDEDREREKRRREDEDKREKERKRQEEEEKEKRQREEEEKRERERNEERERERERERREKEEKERDRYRREEEDRDRDRRRRDEDEDERDRYRRDDWEKDRTRRDDYSRDRVSSYDRGGDHRPSPRQRDREDDNKFKRRWAEEDRRRYEEEDRWRQRQRERDGELRDRWRREEEERYQETSARERRHLEEERERLRQDAKRERQREVAERERRAQERRKQAEATAARLVTDGGFATGTSRGSTPQVTSAGALVAGSSRLSTPRRQSLTPEEGLLHSARTAEPVASVQHASPRTGYGEHGPSVRISPRLEHQVVMEPQHHHAHIEQPHHQRAGSKTATPGGSPKIDGSMKRWPSQTRHGAAIVSRVDGDAGFDSEGSENCNFDEPELAPVAALENVGHTAAAAKRRPATQPSNSRLAGARMQQRPVVRTAARQQQPLAAPISARLEQLKVMSSVAGQQRAAGLWTTENIEEFEDPGSTAVEAGPEERPAPVQGGAELVHASPRVSPSQGQVNGAGSARASMRNAGPVHTLTDRPSRPRSTSTTEAAVQTTGALGSNSAAVGDVLSAALNDVVALEGEKALSSGVPIATVEECILRLLVLQKQLHSNEEPGRAALADAAAGLVPRMLQVLQVARGVCETNRAKLHAFCEERDVDLEKLGVGGAGYMQAQMNALDRLHSQYASLLPGVSGRPFPEEKHPGFQAHSNGGFAQHGVFQPVPRATASSAGRSTPPRLHAAIWGDTTLAPGGYGMLGVTPPPPFQLQTPSMLPDPSFGPSLHDPGVATRQAPLDPGGHGPQVPILRSGGSTPPSAKFREKPIAAGTPSLQSAQLSVSRVPAVGAIGHHPSSARLDQSLMWSTLAQNLPASQSPPSQMFSEQPSSVGSTPRAAAATPRKNLQPAPAASPPRSARSENVQILPAALQHLRGVTDSLVPARRSSSRQRGRREAGGPHAGAGSPSPERERGSSEAAVRQAGERPAAEERAASGPSKRPGGPPEDRYFKILQSLQAKGAVGGLALRTKLLEGSSGGGIAAAVRRGVEGKKQKDLMDRVDGDKDGVLNRREFVSSLRPGALRKGEAMRRLMGPDSESDSSGDGLA